MRIGIDISALPYHTGVSLYTSNLVRALVKTITQDELILFGSSLRRFHHLLQFTQSLDGPHQTSLKPIPPQIMSLLTNTFHLDSRFLTGPVDVFHAWDWYIPANKSGGLVSTVHDLALFKHKDIAPNQTQTHHHQTLTYLIKQKAHLIAVSNTTKQDLINQFQCDSQLITVIEEAMPNEHKYIPSVAEIQAVIKKYHITKPYFLMTGTLEKRKNYPTQMKAWQHFQKDYQLVIAGKPGNEPLTPLPGIILTGAVSAKDLAALYQRASICLYASLYEGFGLPILEAFYHQVPVVTSNISSMPEVAGEAAVTVDPHSVDSLIQGIGKAIQFRSSLISHGTARLQLYSWDTIARKTYQVYQRAAQKS